MVVLEEEKTKFMEKEETTVEENNLELILNSNLVVSLFDSKVTHNFISIRLVKELQLVVPPTQFTITLGMNKGIRRCDMVEVEC